MLFDTSVILDVLLDREPFAHDARLLVASLEWGGLDGLLCAPTITTIYCLANKSPGAPRTRTHVKDLLSLFEIAPVNRPVLESAQELVFADFEDAVLHDAGRHAGAGAIVTRDAQGCARAALPIHAPEVLLKILQAPT